MATLSIRLLLLVGSGGWHPRLRGECCAMESLQLPSVCPCRRVHLTTAADLASPYLENPFCSLSTAKRNYGVITSPTPRCEASTVRRGRVSSEPRNGRTRGTKILGKASSLRTPLRIKPCSAKANEGDFTESLPRCFWPAEYIWGPHLDSIVVPSTCHVTASHHRSTNPHFAMACDGDDDGENYGGRHTY